MRIFNRSTLSQFWDKNPKSEEQLRCWFKVMEKNGFKNSNEILAQFGSADVIGNKVVVFNICGNKYRLIVRFNYEKGLGFIKFVGTHKEYDKIDVKKFKS